MANNALVSYRFDGGEYSFSLPADSWEDAEAKLRAIRNGASVIGFPAYRIPANPLAFPFATLFVRLFTAIRNAMR